VRRSSPGHLPANGQAGPIWKNWSAFERCARLMERIAVEGPVRPRRQVLHDVIQAAAGFAALEDLHEARVPLPGQLGDRFNLAEEAPARTAERLR
jgi:hypothetical protein